MVARRAKYRRTMKSKAARLFLQCFPMRSSRFTITLAIVLCLNVLLWTQNKGWKIDTIKRFADQRSLELPSTVDRNKTALDLIENIYWVVEPIHGAVAWQPVGFDIRPRTTNVVSVGQTSFRGEARNQHEVIVLDVKHIGGDVYRTAFTPSFGLEYNVTVTLTYINDENFNHTTHVDARLVNIRGSPFVIVVENRPPPEGITRYCSQSESGVARGRWVRCGSLMGIEKCGPWQLDAKFDFDQLHGFFWLPYSCQLHYYSNHEMKTCLAKNGWEKIVFTGDSHSRFRTYHWVTRLYGTCSGCKKTDVTTRFEHVPKIEWVFDARGSRWPATFKSINRPKEIYIHPKTRRSIFSESLPESTKNGDLYILNFGHWLLREVTFKTVMAEKVRAYLKAVKLMNTARNNTTNTTNTSFSTSEKRKRFLWVNTFSLQWRDDRYVRESRTTPSPSIVMYMNSFIDREMKNAGIQIVDAFGVANPRVNAAFDRSHYAKVFPDGTCAGVIENAVTNVILNALCND